MRTTLDIDETLMEKVRCLSGIDDRTALIHEGLRALIARESTAMLGGREPGLRPIPRRRPG